MVKQGLGTDQRYKQAHIRLDQPRHFIDKLLLLILQLLGALGLVSNFPWLLLDGLVCDQADNACHQLTSHTHTHSE